MLNLVLKALLKFFIGFLLVALLVFLPAGTFMFLNGLIFLLILFVPMIFLGVYLLLKKRPDSNRVRALVLRGTT